MRVSTDISGCLEPLCKVVKDTGGKTCIGKYGGSVISAVRWLRSFEPDAQPLLASVAPRYEMRETGHRSRKAGSGKPRTGTAQQSLGAGKTHEGVSTAANSGTSLDHSNP